MKIEEEFLNRFKNRCKVRKNKTHLRDDFDDAYIDLVLLSKTKFVLGTHESTFSHHAARIGNKELKLLEIN